MAISGIRNRLNYCVIFIVHTKFTNVAAGRELETHDPTHHVQIQIKAEEHPRSLKNATISWQKPQISNVGILLMTVPLSVY